MPWLQIKIPSSAEDAEHIEEVLQALGAVSITLSDNANKPLYEPAIGETLLWPLIQITALFAAETDVTELQKQLNKQLHLNPSPTIHSEILEDRNWAREWLKDYKPMKFGSQLWVVPDGMPAPEPDCISLVLDPGLAFGTGTHPTTALCLEWLANQALDNCTLIDYGCGSGILGIAAILLGAKHVLGVDHDPQALTATQDNCSRNGLNDSQFKVITPAQIDETSSDIVVANILAAPLIELSPIIERLVKPQGRLVLSGILQSQADEVMTAYKPWFRLNPITVNEDWVRIDGVKI